MTDNKKTVLIVEDERSLRRALVDKFNHEGFNVLEAKDGSEGLDIALKNHPDIILLDIIMPVMDGISMVEKLRMDAWGKTAGVIILTNLSDGQQMLDSMKNGVFEYLVKSNWKIQDVVTKVKQRIQP
jgi:two-component system response regulator ResD